MVSKQNLPEKLDKISFWLFILAVLLAIIYLTMPFVITMLEQRSIISMPNPSAETQYALAKCGGNNTIIYKEENLSPRCVVKDQVLITFGSGTNEKGKNDISAWFEARGGKLLYCSSPENTTCLYQISEDDNLSEVINALRDRPEVWIASPNTILAPVPIERPEEVRQNSTSFISITILLLLFLVVILKGVGWLLRKKPGDK